MISVEEAKNRIKINVSPLNSISIDLKNSLGYVLSEDIIAPISLPPFPQSAMDGYAIGYFKNGTPTNKFKIKGKIKAGDASTISLNEGEAVRIFTGAVVPEGSMSVIMQEVTKVIDNELHIHQEIKVGSNIRPIGEQINIGDIALKKGTILTPAGIGFLSGLGIKNLMVFRKPKVGLIITGNELVEAGNKLENGQIYESNSSTLTTAFQASGIQVSKKIIVKDNLESTVQAIKELLENMDLIILSGGISVGDYDFVNEALQLLNVKEIFYKIKQKPGKPLFYGKKGNCSIFALPGNPSAALLCYYQYVLIAIQKMTGASTKLIEKRTLLIQSKYLKKDERAHFLKAIATDDQVELLEGQSSAMLHTFALANALVFIPENKNITEIGERVETYLLP